MSNREEKGERTEIREKAIKITTALKGKKELWLILALLVFGLILIFFGSGNKKTPEKVTTTPDTDEYISELEKKLEAQIEHMSGAGKASVIICADGSYEDVYVNDAALEKRETENEIYTKSEKTLVYTSDSSGTKLPVERKKIYPKLRGVSVVCEGAGDARLAKNIIMLVKTVLGLPSSRIFVTGGRK